MTRVGGEKRDAVIAGRFAKPAKGTRSISLKEKYFFDMDLIKVGNESAEMCERYRSEKAGGVRADDRIGLKCCK
jgi:hypothetical protein